MPREFSRARRVGEQIQRELAVLIRSEIRDPRLGMVSVSAVEVSRDLAHAKVFFSTLGDAGAADRSLEVLNGAAPYLRHLLGKRLVLRSVPQLHFHQDHSLEEGARLSALIDRAVHSDHEHADSARTDEDEV
jgi:ribosome-binding factor A